MRQLTCSVENWSLKRPFHITGYTFSEVAVLHASICEGDQMGQGEATGIYYLQETGSSLLAQAQSVSGAIADGASRDDLLRLLPAGGARNALDAALWDLEAKQAGKRVWEMLGIPIQPVVTVNTVGIGSPADMATVAKSLDTDHIKVKLNDDMPLERLRAVRAARPDAVIVVDVNAGWTFAQLQALAPRFRDLGVAMIEQPLPRGADSELEGYKAPLPLCADESCLDTTEFEQAAKRYQMINIKLDKTGGLTEALRLAAMARDRGIDLMVGNMVGTSLGMAPGFVIAQQCRFVDLDGALLLRRDRDHPMSYTGGVVMPPPVELWG
ncbi:N-acetyl-D-Glu racemase DgcA [Chromatocurvus halotolerans]|uniref:Dipeptide epimerase n=1 Tax=Chromatocurvus halotolerans TaxID=1132028 RepID=A0A4R2KN44_9GAMM|nr:N-acetyl-D-Glu racemase DgcA [Chromatocurvus halotolerans]TCO74884.1 L-alanine-DL-glutamate epimerase-like enolase superfamily enzyme [Chromatocurvus halotolerans]